MAADTQGDGFPNDADALLLDHWRSTNKWALGDVARKKFEPCDLANPGGGGTDDGEREREFERKNVEDLEDPKMFNVILLGDEDYTQEHICKALLDVVEDVQIKQAEEIFLEAQKGGQANVCTTSQELAEHYVQQFARKDSMIFCEMLLPLLASEALRHDGFIEGLSPLELRLSELFAEFYAEHLFGVSACASFTRH